MLPSPSDRSGSRWKFSKTTFCSTSIALPNARTLEGGRPRVAAASPAA
jgi:hypothetical protein